MEGIPQVQKEEEFHSTLAEKLGIAREETKGLASYSTRNKGGKDGEEQSLPRM